MVAIPLPDESVTTTIWFSVSSRTRLPFVGTGLGLAVSERAMEMEMEGVTSKRLPEPEGLFDCEGDSSDDTSDTDVIEGYDSGIEAVDEKEGTGDEITTAREAEGVSD
jgi:hypothetical protein